MWGKVEKDDSDVREPIVQEWLLQMVHYLLLLCGSLAMFWLDTW